MAQDPSARGLLGGHSQTDSHRRRSHEKDDRRHSDSDSDSDFDTTEYLDREAFTFKSPASSNKPAFLPRRQWTWSCWRPLAGRSRCFIVAIAIGLAIWLILGAGGAFVYKKFKDEPPYGQSPPWYPAPKGGIASTWAESYAKAYKMVSKMTLAEKVNVTTGTGWQMGLAVGTNAPAVYVGFPQLQLQDGPLGIRFADNITAFPAGITVGATWNRELMYARGKAHAIEAREKGINVLLGPCVGPLGRMPAGGRNWEGFGADPYLQGIAGAETTRGIQSEGVMATIKHFVANEQEHFRQPWEWGLPHAVSSNIDDRTLHELYAWPFGDAVKAGVASVMCSYNQVNNSYSCGNSKLLNGILKDELGFQGFVMSDWLAQRGGVSTALAGLDMTMPGDGLRWANGESLWGPELSKAVLNGSVPVERLNDMVTRIVAAWYQLGQDDETKFPRTRPNFSSWTDEKMGVLSPGSPSEQEEVEVNQFKNVQANHSIIARQVAAEGTVLLKNDGPLLPLTPQGFSESNLKMRRNVLARVANRAAATGKIKVGVFGDDAGPGKGPNYCKDRGCNEGTLGSGWGSGAVEFPYLVTPIHALKEGFDSKKVHIHEYITDSPPFDKSSEQETLSSLELCIVFVNADSGEGFTKWADVSGDRPNINLQKGGDRLIKQVSSKCGPEGLSDVIVVIHSVGPVLMEEWIELPNVKAVLLANLPGQESGHALVDILFGKTNPSGHLPYTIGKSLDDYGPGAKVMYTPNGVVPQQDFKEGLYIDYRYFDKYGVEPRFPFGFGLSYTEFGFSNVVVEEVKKKSRLPAPRPKDAADPPRYSIAKPDITEVRWPEGFRRLEKYIYPYVEAEDEAGLVGNGESTYPYPDGYDKEQPLSQAGGAEGGNPDLWEVYVKVKVDVENTGLRDGAVVAQLYMGYPEIAPGPGGGEEDGDEKVDFPVRVLRGFEKVWLKKGEKKTVEFALTRRDLSYWNVEVQNWVMVTRGVYEFRIGESSRDERWHGGVW